MIDPNSNAMDAYVDETRLDNAYYYSDCNYDDLYVTLHPELPITHHQSYPTPIAVPGASSGMEPLSPAAMYPVPPAWYQSIGLIGLDNSDLDSVCWQQFTPSAIQPWAPLTDDSPLLTAL